MRIHGRLSNPLLRKVQRHTRVSTLFHATGREIAPDEPRAAPLRVRPVQASLLPPEPVVAPFAAGTLLGAPAVLRPAPQAAPVQTFPTPPRSAAAPAAGGSPVQQPEPLSPAAIPASRTQPVSTPPVVAPEVDQGKAEEDRNWKRLQTIMRKHEEKQQAEQTSIESEPQPVAGQPQPAAGADVPPERQPVPSAAPAQRRTNVVEEVPAAAAGQPVQAKAVPPLVEFGAPGAAISAAPVGELRPSPSRAEPSPAEGEHRPEPARPVQRTIEPAKPLPAAAAAPEVLPPSPETPHPPERIQRKPAPQEQPETVPAPPGAAQVETPTLPLHPEAGHTAPAAAEAPTLRIPRASLGLEQAQPVQPSELPRTFEQETPAVIAGPEIAAPTERPESQKLPGEPADAILRLGAPVVQRQTESNPEALERPDVQAPPVAPDRPAIHTPQGTPDRQAGGPPPLVKASLGGAPAIQRVPESSTVPPQAAPVPRPVVPAAVEPLPSYFEPLLGAPNASLPGASLEAVWPVQRLPDTAIPPKPVPPGVPAAGESPEVLPHNEHVGQILQSVASGLPSDSLVELVTPRKPRPASERKETPPVQRQKSPEAPQPAVQTEPATVIAPPPGEALAREAASVRPEVKPVQTEIGPLPSDLWGLIGQPQPETAQPPALPVQAHPVRQSALQRHVTENEPVQRELTQPAAPPEMPHTSSPEEQPPAEQPEEVNVPETEAYYEAVIYPSGTADAEGPANVVQRAVEISEITSEVEPPSPGGEQAGPGPNVEELAQRVYSEIRRRLSVEFERWRRSG